MANAVVAGLPFGSCVDHSEESYASFLVCLSVCLSAIIIVEMEDEDHGNRKKIHENYLQTPN